MKEALHLLKNLVAIPSAYFEEENIISYIKEWFDTLGIPSERSSFHEAEITDFKGSNILLRIEGSQPGPTLCINAHVDTVKPSNGWTRHPWGEEVEGRFYGIGSLDMKAGVASAMLAAEALYKRKSEMKGTLLITLVSGEEGPFGLGTDHVINSGFLEDVDYSIVTEPSAGFNGVSFPDLCLGARGGYGLSVHLKGRSSHAATPELGISAADDAARFMVALQSLEHREDELLGHSTPTVIQMHADGGACSTPESAVVTLFWHTVRGETPSTIEETIQRLVKSAKINSEVQVRFRESPSPQTRGFDPYVVDGDDPYTVLLRDTIKDITGKEARLSYFKSIGDFNYLGTRVGAPCVIFGAMGSNFHGPDEYVLLDSFYQSTEILIAFLERLFIA